MTYVRVYHESSVLTNGKVLVIGGMEAKNDALNSTELYNPLTGTLTMTGSMKYPRVLHTASLLNNENVLITGGSTELCMFHSRIQIMTILSYF